MMNFSADTHVLGSRDGYSTLVASETITQEERLQLEALRYGQTDNHTFLHSLHDRPSVIGRPLCSGRYAITRCFMGSEDTAGRTTVMFVSLIFSQNEWLHVISRNVPAIIGEHQYWKSAQESGEVVRGSIPPIRWTVDMRAGTLRLLSGFTHLNDRETLGLDDTSVNNLCIQLLPDILPAIDRVSFRWGNRVLSAGAGLQVSTYPAVADLSSRDRLITLKLVQSKLSLYAQALEQYWDQPHYPPRSFIDAAPGIKDFRHNGTDHQHSELDASQAHSGVRPRLIYLILVLLSMLVIAGYAVVSLKSRNSEQSNNTSAQNSDSNSGKVASKREQEIQENGRSSEHATNADTNQANSSLHGELSYERSSSSEDGLTPNEYAAHRLVTEFESAGEWDVPRIKQWIESTSALFHVEEVPGFATSRRRAIEVMGWVQEARATSGDVQYLLLYELAPPYLNKSTDDDITIAIQRLRAMTSDLKSLLHDPRRTGFAGITDQGIKFRLIEIEAMMRVCLELLDTRARAELAAKRLALQAQVGQTIPTVQDLERVVAEAKKFARHGSRPNGIEDWDLAPSVDTLEEWWALLDFATFPDLPRELILPRKHAHDFFHRALLWRFKALRHYAEQASDPDEKNHYMSEVERLLILHQSIDSNKQSEELEGMSYEDFKKEMEP